MPLLRRDALLLHLSGVIWPFAPLLDVLNLVPEADVLDVGAGDGRLLKLLPDILPGLKTGGSPTRGLRG